MIPQLSNLKTSVLTRRSQQGEEGGPAPPPPPGPPLGAFERDSNGRVVYVDLIRGERSSILEEQFDRLRARLAAVAPSDDTIVRSGKRINENRFLWTITDGMAIDLFSAFLQSAANDLLVGVTLRVLLAPLGRRIRLLGAHFICGRLSETTPQIFATEASPRPRRWPGRSNCCRNAPGGPANGNFDRPDGDRGR